ncbi:MAG: DNA polymerase III subunit delta', partial [Desulfobacteraceae bacterium]
MPGFDSIIGQKHPIRLLKRFLRNGTLPHALLFTGIEGVGKRTAAAEIAMALNCADPQADKKSRRDPSQACGTCPPCRQIRSNNHPDIITVTPHNNLLRIDQIRKLIHALAMKPFSARHRVVIIAKAQTMNPEAANALLKILEEPPQQTTLILTAPHRSELLPTIVSRCRRIAFEPLASEDLQILLADKLGADKKRAQIIVAMAGGSYAKARMLADDTWQYQRSWILRAAGLDAPGELNHRPATEALAFSAQLAQHKDNVMDLLDMLKTWIRDLSIHPYQPGRIINRDRKDLIGAIRSDMDEHRLLDLWDAVEKAQKDIAARANLRLTLDVMALRMAG